MNILHLEDNDNDATLIREVLLNEIPGCRFTQVETRSAFAEALERPDWEIILADYSLPSFDGIAALGMRAETMPEVPFIFVTGALGEEKAVDALRRGATDFVLKHRLAELPKAILRAGRESASTRAKKDADTRLKDSLHALEKSRQEQLRFKDEFLSHVSHELRSPLTAIKQFTSILISGQPGSLNEEQHHLQEIVLKNIGQLQSMIDDLLEVTQLETGKMTFELQSLAIPDVVTDAFDTVQLTARAKTVGLSCNVPTRLPMAHGDPTRLRQILIILLDNAIKFTPAGGTVTVAVRPLAQDPSFLVFEVSDTGCGISSDKVERIFEHHYQIPGSTQTSRKGLGLGLYICRGLVMRQGGRIWVESRPEEGSTFLFTLPVFSLNRLIAPLLRKGVWPADSLALVAIAISLREAWPSKESEDEWRREARALLQGCLVPVLDVMLPTIAVSPHEERTFVATFVDDKGAAAMTLRIREQFKRLLHNYPQLTVWVSYSMVRLLPDEVGSSTETMVTGMAKHLENSMRSHNEGSLKITETSLECLADMT
jgi:signal transduction histidine kinase